MSIFGGTFKPFVIKQITARQALMSQGINVAGGKRSRNVQLYTSAKTSWVKMASFVDYSSDPKVASNDSLARKYVLMGGTLWDNPEKLLNPELKYGVDTPRGRGAYTSTDGLGHKLMPGITSISVNNEGAYGSLRSATISYKCWTKQQLDDLEILYMRAGYPVLLEWGWSMYIDTATKEDNDPKRKSDRGDLNVTPTDLAKFIEKPLQSWNGTTINPFDPNKTLETLYDDIERLQAKYSGNYDGMVGIVKNFSYKLEVDGSYTCTTNLISMGDALASIKMNKPSKEQQAFEDLVTGYKTSFTALMSQLSVGTTTGVSPKAPIPTLVAAPLPSGGLASTSNQIFVSQGQAVRTPVNVQRQSFANKIGSFVVPEGILQIPGIDVEAKHLPNFANSPYDSNTFPTYIQLAFLIALINSKFNTYLDGNPMVNVELPVYGMEGNLGNGLCLASADSVSIDPAVCIIKNSKAEWITNNPKKGYYVKPVEGRDIDYKDFLITDEASDYHNMGQIGNIYVCVQHASKVFNNAISNSEVGEVGIYTFLKELLKGISYALGSVNNFDLYTTDSRAVIIDKNYTELPTKSKKENKFQLNIFGIDSIVRDFKIESKIFQSQSHMMAIGAGGKMNLGGVNSSTQDYFNRGLANRLLTTISEDPTPKTEKSEREERVEEAGKVLQLTKYLQDFLIGNSFPATQEAVASANTQLKDILLKVNTDLNYRAIIPVNVEITLDGIAGIAIGEVFRLNTTMLPKDYDRKDIGFITSKLSHSIVNSQWLTTLGAYVILLDQDDLDKGNGSIALSGLKKAELAGYVGEYKAKTRENLEEYRLMYIKILHFLAEYFAGNLKVGLGQTKVARKVQVGGTLKTDFAANPVYKNLYISPQQYAVTDYSVIITDLMAPSADGTYIYSRSGLLPTIKELDKGNMGFLDTFKRGLNRDNALKKTQDIIKSELNRLTDFKVLSEKAKPLADDILRAIDTVVVQGSVKVNTSTGTGTTSTNSVTPIRPLLQEDGLTVNYEVREGTPIKIEYNPADNKE